MANFTINKVALQDIGQLPWTLQDWMRSVKRAINGGLYTPTLTNVTNITSSTAYECQWQQIENTVVVSGKIGIDTAGAGASELGISLPPLYPSQFTAEEQCGGVATTVSGTHNSAGILANATNDRAAMHWSASGGGGVRSWAFTFTYRII